MQIFLLVVVLVPEGGRVTARGSRALTGQNKNRGRADAADPAPVLFFGLFWRRGVDCRFCAYLVGQAEKRGSVVVRVRVWGADEAVGRRRDPSIGGYGLALKWPVG